MAYKTYKYKGKDYRCIEKPKTIRQRGSWEYLYKGSWTKVKNDQIRIELNRLAGYYDKLK